MQRLVELLTVVLWEYIARPLNDVENLFHTAETSWGKLLVLLSSPLLFVWFAAFQASEGE